jgi:hypothetical protein
MEDMRVVTDHMEVYRTQPDVIYPLPHRKGDPAIHVHKLGGGSPDVPHAGTWICQLVYAGELVFSTAEMETGMPHSHYEVAGIFAETLVYGEKTHPELTEGQHTALDGALEEFWCNVQDSAEQNGRAI